MKGIDNGKTNGNVAPENSSEASGRQLRVFKENN